MKQKQKKLNFIIFLIGLFLFAYTLSRAYLLSFTRDESCTYLEYVRKGVFVLSHYNTTSANNHILNTWLMELSSKLFGVNEFTLRLPNLMAHILYIFYSAKLVGKMNNKILIIGGFIILNLNPFLLDFFSLARGYGLSIALMMASLYYSYKYISEKTTYRSAFISLLFASIALISYFIMLNYILIVVLIFLIINLKRNEDKKEKIKSSLIIISPLLILFFVIPIMLQLKHFNALSFGGKEGFWKATVESLILATLYDSPMQRLLFIFESFVIVILLSSLILEIVNITNKNIQKHSFFIFILTITLLIFTLNYLQNKFFGIAFLGGRYALIYFPLFALLMIFLFNTLFQKSKKIISGLFIVFVLFFITNFSIAANFHYTNNWVDDADKKNMINYLSKNKKEISTERNNITMGLSLPFETTINFYRTIYHLSWLNETTGDDAFHPLYDYYFLDKNDVDSLKEIPCKVIKEFPESNKILVSNEIKWKSKVIYYKHIDFDNPDINEHFSHISDDISYKGTHSSKTDTSSNYSDGFSYIIDDSLINNKNAIVLVKAMVYSENLTSDALLVVSFEDSKPYSYNTVNIEDYIHKTKEWSPVNFTVFVPKGVKKNDQIKCYLWNTGNYPVYIDEMEFKIVAYQK